MLLLSTKSLAKSFGARTLFSNISLSLDDADRSALIGPNGAGKSTFLKILADLEHPDSGNIEKRRNLRLAYLPQHDLLAPGRTVEQILLDELRADHIDDHEHLSQIAITLGKVGFTDFDKPVSALSGGWRKRLAIARALITEPDLLLLDEPTNHLDLAGVLWLEKLLTNAPFAFLLVSHDRYFLQNVTNRTIELNAAFPEGFLSHNGHYSDYLEKREEFLVAQHAQQTALASRVRREIEWLRRGAKARTTKAKGRIQQASEMMTDLADLKTRNAAGAKVQIDFTASNRQTRKLLVANKISKTLGDKPLFSNLDLVLSPGSKLGLVGPNGSGKTTLLKILANQLPPDTGSIRHADGLKIVLFDQARAQLDPNATLRHALSPQGDSLSYRGESIHVTGWAKRFLFRVDQLDLPVSQLSGGEQSRVLIANLMRTPADLLILDEPTNDLDIPSLEVLEDSLETFPGALVLVTHDRYLIDNLCTDILGLDGQGRAALYADLSQYQSALAPTPKPQPAKIPNPTTPTSTSKPQSKRLTWKEQKEWDQMEDNIQSAEQEVEQYQKQLEDPAVLADRQKLHDLCTQLESAQSKVANLYTRWQELQSKQQ